MSIFSAHVVKGVQWIAMNPSIAMFCLLLRGRNSFVLPFFEICLLNQRAAEDPFGFAVLYGALYCLPVYSRNGCGQNNFSKKGMGHAKARPFPKLLGILFLSAWLRHNAGKKPADALKRLRAAAAAQSRNLPGIVCAAHAPRKGQPPRFQRLHGAERQQYAPANEQRRSARAKRRTGSANRAQRA